MNNVNRDSSERSAVTGSKSHTDYIAKSTKKIVINRVIEEVNLNTPDSIGLAIKTLESKHIKIPQSLKELQTLHDTIQKGRDTNFAQQSEILKDKALNDLNELIQ